MLFVVLLGLSHHWKKDEKHKQRGRSFTVTVACNNKNSTIPSNKYYATTKESEIGVALVVNHCYVNVSRNASVFQ